MSAQATRLGVALRKIPPSWHWVPHCLLLMWGVVLIFPGVLPTSSCNSLAPEAKQFIHLSAPLFGAIEALLLLSAVAASAGRRDARPGVPTMILSCLLGAITLSASVAPTRPLASPAVALLILAFFAALGVSYTNGIALVLVIALLIVIARALRGPTSLRFAQIAAWTTALLILPGIAAFVYLTASPICLD